jgi:multiple sugar transport system substrate-binding protein
MSLVLAAGVSLFGVGAAQQLVVLGPWAGDEEAQFRPVLEAFEEETGISVEYRTYRSEDLVNILPAQFGAGRTIGDVIVMWDWWISENTDHIVAITDIVREVPFVTGAEPTEVDGEVYGASYVMAVKPGFWYRQSFFEEHGLSEPESWEEFEALLEQIQGIDGVNNAIAAGNGVGWPLSDITEHFLIAFGGPELQHDLIDGNVGWQSDEVRQIFEERLVPLLEAGYFSDPIEWTSAVELWWRGDYGLFFMGNWITGMVEEPDDLGVFTLPGAEAVVGAPDTVFIPRYSENVDAARQLLAFMLSREGVEIRVAEGGKLSMREDVGPDAYPGAEQALAGALEGLGIVPDLDDSVGGGWQATFWDQLKLLWVDPGALDDVLEILDEER